MVRNRGVGYDDEENKTPNEIIDALVDIVSKNGNLLLNIGPKPDGTISQEQTDVLLAIGDWLKVNGEGIYGSRPWDIAEEGTTEAAEGSFGDAKRSCLYQRRISGSQQRGTACMPLCSIGPARR